MNIKEYIHPRKDEEVGSISGRYAFTREGTLEYRGRQVLYLTGYSVTDSACCGFGGCVFSLVPGFVERLHRGKTADGKDISDVDPVTDNAMKDEIASLIKEREPSTQVNFL